MRLAAALAVVVLCSARHSDACSCVPPMAWVSPGPLDTAPVNAHLFVTFDEHGYSIGTPNVAATSHAAIGLRTAAHDTVPAATVPTHVIHRTVMGNFVHDEIAPDHVLAPDTRHEVLLVIEPAGKSTPIVIGTFATRAAADVAPPVWSATIEEAALEHAGGLMPCGEGDAMRLRVPAVKDESAVRWEIFVAPGDVSIDWTKAPTAVQLPMERYPNGKSLLVIGHDPCSPSVPLPKSNSVRIGVRPIDVAGHVGQEAEIVRSWPAKKP